MKLDQVEYENLLIQQLAEGSEKAFTTLYDQYSSRLFSSILKMVKDEDVAKEILQDSFLKVWESREKIDADKSFRSYLYKISENRIYDYFRKLSRDKKLIKNLIITALTQPNVFENTNNHEEIIQLVQEAIQQLSPIRRQVFIMSRIERKSYAEIACDLSISVSTVSDHLVKANRSIRKFVHLHQDLTLSLIVSLLLSSI